ncbi:hypothetical protein ACH4NS_27315 [Streptomyces mutabilis]|uniref:hypothetical protein n=1 Tax=Streptomyces mutabilis TaxID=67332 RepID=UPI00379C39AA|nr:hypothetical protein [Streptomyces sp. DH17]
MGDVAPFLGLTSPVRRALSRTVLEGAPWSAEPDRRSAADGCPSGGPVIAVDLLRRHVTHRSSGFPSVARHPRAPPPAPPGTHRHRPALRRLPAPVRPRRLLRRVREAPRDTGRAVTARTAPPAKTVRPRARRRR